jgi:hypothetical protein
MLFPSVLPSPEPPWQGGFRNRRKIRHVQQVALAGESKKAYIPTPLKGGMVLERSHVFSKSGFLRKLITILKSILVI